MRIGLDYTSAITQGAGIGRYTRCLVDELLKLDGGHDYCLLSAHGTPEGGVDEIAHRARVVTLPFSERWTSVLWHRLRLPLWADLWSGTFDLFHSPDFLLPPLRTGRTIVTVHDLSFIRVPECAYPALRRYLQTTVPRSLRRADLVLADSHSTKSDLIELLGSPERQVRVVHLGVEPRFRPLECGELDQARALLDLPEHFVLAVGTLQPRKNYVRLITAFSQLRKAAACPHRLVIVGGEGWLYEDIYRRAEEDDIKGLVVFPGHISDDLLPALYNLADLFVFPSLYEGFGLPPLESMACGTPVVASSISSIPEVVGQAAILVDPRDTEGMTEAMRKGLFDRPICDKIVQAGFKRVREFTWTRAAQSVLDIYEEVGSAQ